MFGSAKLMSSSMSSMLLALSSSTLMPLYRACPLAALIAVSRCACLFMTGVYQSVHTLSSGFCKLGGTGQRIRHGRKYYDRASQGVGAPLARRTLHSATITSGCAAIKLGMYNEQRPACAGRCKERVLRFLVAQFAENDELGSPSFKRISRAARAVKRAIKTAALHHPPAAARTQQRAC